MQTGLRTVRLAFSPDADDIFMFWPLLSGRVPTPGLSFVHERVETESLNARAESPDAPDVCAVSIAHVPAIADRFLLLPHGASVGRGYGPVVVAKSPLTLAALAGARVAIPGARTTAHLVLRLLLLAETGRSYVPVGIPITPFARVFEALDRGEVDAALLIHEGRLTYKDDPSLHAVVEIGEAWHRLTGSPLPLGGNVIRRDLGDETIRAVSDACRRSIAWSLEHRDEVLDEIVASGLRAEAKLERARLDRYLAMYANEDSATMADDVTRALTELLERGRVAGLLPDARVELAP
jgi:1,4-dihydroxy-6-naphthoate synthase